MSQRRIHGKCLFYLYGNLPTNIKNDVVRIYCDVDREFAYRHELVMFNMMLKMGFIWVFSIDDEVVGFLLTIIGPDMEFDRDTHLVTNLYIDSRYRGNGIGRMLHQSFEKCMQNSQNKNNNRFPENMTVSCTIKNLDFWLKMGYGPETKQLKDSNNIILYRKLDTKYNLAYANTGTGIKFYPRK